jgi:integrase
LSAVRNFAEVRTVDVCEGRISVAKTHLRLVAPTEVKRTVPPKRQKNAALRTREHLTPDEVGELIEAAKGNRHGRRDATMILLAFRHGLRAAEVCDLRWDQVDFAGAVLHVRRVKNGAPSTHPGGRGAGPAPAPARESGVALRVRQRARLPVQI